MKILSLSLAIALMASSAMAADFDLDRGIGFEKGHDIEDWAEAKRSSNRIYGGTLSRNNSTPMAQSIGNAIAVKAEANSHVVINASQINTGNQTAEVKLNGSMNNTNLRNVETNQANDDMYVRYNQ